MTLVSSHFRLIIEEIKIEVFFLLNQNGRTIEVLTGFHRSTKIAPAAAVHFTHTGYKLTDISDTSEPPSLNLR